MINEEERKCGYLGEIFQGGDVEIMGCIDWYF